VVIGRAQLFTENTLYPVVLVLEDRRHAVPTLRLWAVVFTANVFGALVFAALATWTGALEPAVLSELIGLGTTAAGVPPIHVFTGAILGGWMVALMAWLVSGARDTIGQVTVIWMMTFLVGLLHLAHCIASSGYILAAVLAGDVSVPTYAAWLALATMGNILGGVVIVSLLNYGQVRAGATARERQVETAAR
jgi:formate/nitrite transporter FocA (FNT family)